jgi:hypothetical protein
MVIGGQGHQPAHINPTVLARPPSWRSVRQLKILICFISLTFLGCSLPERPPMEMPRDWCKEVDKNCA